MNSLKVIELRHQGASTVVSQVISRGIAEHQRGLDRQDLHMAQDVLGLGQEKEAALISLEEGVEVDLEDMEEVVVHLEEDITVAVSVVAVEVETAEEITMGVEVAEEGLDQVVGDQRQ